eukprot:4698161-Pyramimonas_sp.AAC.1
MCSSGGLAEAAPLTKNPTSRLPVWVFPSLWDLGFLFGLFLSLSSDWLGFSGWVSYLEFVAVGALGALRRVAFRM